LSYVLDVVTAGTTVVGASGVTTCAGPLGSAFITLDLGPDGVLTNRERIEFVVELINGSATAITYTPRLLAGSGAR
jgi:hypothetical protein